MSTAVCCHIYVSTDKHKSDFFRVLVLRHEHHLHMFRYNARTCNRTKNMTADQNGWLWQILDIPEKNNVGSGHEGHPLTPESTKANSVGAGRETNRAWEVL